MSTPTPDPVPTAADVHVVVLDSENFAMSLDEAIEHVNEHVQRGDSTADEDDCSQCPKEVGIRMGDALPSPPDEQGLNSRAPWTYRSAHLVMAYEDLSWDEWEDAVLRLQAMKVVAEALSAARLANHSAPSEPTP